MCNFFCSFFLISFAKDGETALHNVADRGFAEIVKILVEHGANINIQTTVL